jgi:hypothetical protein
LPFLSPSSKTGYLKNWIPYKLTDAAAAPLCNWLYTGGELFTEPFFDETILKCKTLAENHRRYKPASSPEWMAEQATALKPVRPAAVIFHISRCGSTLLSQLLGMHPGCTSLAEVPFFDDLLRLPLQNPAVNITQAEALLAAAVPWYAQQSAGEPGRLFIKTDSWHLFFYNAWRHLYPGVPFIILYRSPKEVLRSQQRKRGMHAIPGFIEPELFGIDRARIQWHDFDHWMCMVLERYLQTALEIVQKDALVLPLSYHDGMLNVMRQMSEFCKIPFTETQWSEMEQRSQYHGKFPGEVFAEPQQEQPVPPAIDAAMKLFERLEKQTPAA